MSTHEDRSCASLDIETLHCALAASASLAARLIDMFERKGFCGRCAALYTAQVLCEASVALVTFDASDELENQVNKDMRDILVRAFEVTFGPVSMVDISEG